MARFPETIEAAEQLLVRHVPRYRVPPLGPHRLSVGEPEEIRDISEAFLGDAYPPYYDTKCFQPTKGLVGVYKGVGLITSRTMIQVDKLGNAKHVDDRNDLLFRVTIPWGVARRGIEWYHDPLATEISDERVVALALMNIHELGRRTNGDLSGYWNFRAVGAELYTQQHPYHEQYAQQVSDLLGKAMRAQTERILAQEAQTE